MNKKLIFDIETYPNFFCVSFLDMITEELIIFEISSRKNQLQELISFFNNISRISSFVGFNSGHFDSPILNYILDNAGEFSFMTGEEIAFRVKDVSDAIINSSDGYFPSWLYPQKYHKKWIDVDLYLLLWSREIRISKAVSLKKLGIQLGYPVTMELPYPHYENLDETQMDKVIEYNSIHDIGITRMLTEKVIYFQGKKTTVGEQVKMRFDAQKKYGFPLHSTSWDGVKLGVQILLKSYADKYNLNYWDLSKKKSFEGKTVVLKDIISPIIKFDESGDISFKIYKEKGAKVKTYEFRSFYGLYQWLLKQTVHSTKEINCRIWYKEVCYDVKSGGLHTVHKPEYIAPKAGQTYRTVDVSSFYPATGVLLEVSPPSFSGLHILLKDIKDQRVLAKREGRSSEDRLFKLALNGGYFGSLNSETNPLYYPKGLLTITLNGQLALLMLAERLVKIGVQIDSANTDGLELLYDCSKEDEVQSVMKQWEIETTMELEADEYIRLVRRHVNDYIAITKSGGVKTKGSTFVTHPDIGNSCDNLIIAYALEAYYSTNTPPEVFIPKYLEDNPNDGIYAFCSSQKVAKSYVVVWGGEEQQQINRYYVCKTGKYLYKQRNGGCNAIMKGIPIKIYNNHSGRNPDDIDVQWYINECRKVIEEISPTVKTTLF